MRRGQLMQQSGLHRTTQWRHRIGRKNEKSGFKGNGRGRRTKAQDLETIGLAAWILDSLRDKGYCYTWELLVAPRVTLQDLEDEEVLHHGIAKLRCGSEKTVCYLMEQKLPAGLILFVVATLAFDYGLEPRDQRTLKRYAEESDEEHVAVPLITASQAHLVRSAFRQADEDKRMRYQRDRQIKIEVQQDEQHTGLTNRSHIHEIAELRGCGLSKQTCSKWRKDARFRHAASVVGEFLEGNPPYMENQSSIYVRHD